MGYRRRYGYGRRPANGPSPVPDPVITDSSGEIDVDALVRAMRSADAPSYRAFTTSTITATSGQPDAYMYAIKTSLGGKRGYVTIHDGRKKVDSLSAGRIVLIETLSWGWRISTSSSPEPTPICLSQSKPTGAVDVITEAYGLTVYQTPITLLHSALFQHEKGRTELGLAMMQAGILIKARALPPDAIALLEKPYARFRKTAALALQPGTPDEGNAARIAAIRVGTSILHN